MGNLKLLNIKECDFGWELVTDKGDVYLTAKKEFNFSYPELPISDIKFDDYNYEEHSINIFLDARKLIEKPINRMQNWKIQTNLEIRSSECGEYRLELKGLYDCILYVKKVH